MTNNEKYNEQKFFKKFLVTYSRQKYEEYEIVIFMQKR